MFCFKQLRKLEFRGKNAIENNEKSAKKVFNEIDEKVYFFYFFV